MFASLSDNIEALDWLATVIPVEEIVKPSVRRPLRQRVALLLTTLLDFSSVYYM